MTTVGNPAFRFLGAGPQVQGNGSKCKGGSN